MKDIDYLKKYYKGNLDEAIKKLEGGIPVQYIVGNVDFYNYNFLVNKDVLIPRFETEELVEKTINLVKENFKDKIDIIDLGTGSGCIAITLKKELNCNVDALDISDKALEIAKANAKRNNAIINFINRDMLSPLDKKYDCIISNPPYIAYDEEIMEIVKNNEPELALYASDSGLYYYKELLKNIKKYLKDKFIIAFEIGEKQGNVLKEYTNIYFQNCNIYIEKDLTGVDRFLFITNV